MNHAYAPIQLPSTAITDSSDSDTAELVVENRNDFSNLSEFRFEWTAGDRKGSGSADVAAQARGALTLTGLKGTAEQDVIELRAVQKVNHGKWFDRVELSLPATANSALPADARLVGFAQGAEDPALAALYFNFGRYLLISCNATCYLSPLVTGSYFALNSSSVYLAVIFSTCPSAKATS